jgi:cation transport regulator ChaC
MDGQYIESDLWVFGYGSLIFRPDFPFVERREGFISGWARRFWQASHDHRGTRECPGRVVTLIESPGARCWGVAYRVAPEHVALVLERLDDRESGGYKRRTLAFTAVAGNLEAVTVYVADHENPNFVGPEEERHIAEIVRDAIGQSGANREYVLRLAEALISAGEHDPHVVEIVRALTK